MNKTTHPIEPEELMAHVDGELTAEREAAVLAHVDECVECRTLTGELKAVSGSLRAWKIAYSDTSIPPTINKALDGVTRTVDGGRNNAGKAWWPWKWIYALAGGALAVFIAGSLLIPDLHRSRHDVLPKYSVLNSTANKSRDKAVEVIDRAATGPMIIRTAQLALITKDFDKARESVESILKRHRGYVGELKVSGSTGSGRTLTGTLRVPADQLDAMIADLKPLGRVESESQSGQDVTSQYVDLQARLTNARNTEQRLTDLLRNRTGKLSDVLEVEQELDRVRGEIEQMEAERKNMSNQVSYATVSLTVTEDYRAQLQVVPPSTSTRLLNAAVDGYRSVVNGILSATLFLLSTGPTLLVWGLILFFPARLLWRKARRMAQ